MPMTTQLPLPDTVEVSVSEPELLVTFTLNMLPDRVAATVVALGSCLGPISYFSRSAFTSARRHSHCALRGDDGAVVHGERVGQLLVVGGQQSSRRSLAVGAGVLRRQQRRSRRRCSRCCAARRRSYRRRRARRR